MRRGYRQFQVMAVVVFTIAAVPAVHTVVAASAALQVGDIVVADRDYGGSGGVFRIDPETGEQTLLSEGQNLMKPWGIGMDPYGRILVADADCCGGEIDPFGGGQGGVIRIDPQTGEQVVVSSEGSFKNPRAVVMDASGDILVADSRCCGTRFGGILRVDPETGEQQVVSAAAPFFDDPYGVDVEASGMIVTSDTDCCVDPDLGGVIRVDPATGTQTVVASGENFVEPIELAVDAAGAIWVADTLCCGSAAVIRVDPATGDQQVVSSGGKLRRPAGIAVEADGMLVVADAKCCGATGGIIRVDPATGAQEVLTSGGMLQAPISVDVVTEIQPLVGPTGTASPEPEPSLDPTPDPTPSPTPDPTIADFKIGATGAVTAERDAAVNGVLACGAGHPWEITAQVDQRSTGASAQGITSGTCSGERERWDVVAAHGSGPAFVPGTVRVCATATLFSEGQPADTESLCRSVSLT